MTIRTDARGGTAILKPDGTVDRVLDIPDPNLNALCRVWSADDRRLGCYGWTTRTTTPAGCIPSTRPTAVNPGS
jgi:hypothetical protein